MSTKVSDLFVISNVMSTKLFQSARCQLLLEMAIAMTIPITGIVTKMEEIAVVPV
jgi:hypothetical protein